jgi:DNA repair protein RecO (recombination protein O)
MEQTEAILIRKQAWSDTSLITTWLTSGHGKITAMARAARRPSSPFAGRLDLFHKAEIGYAMPKRGSLHTLSEVRLVEVFGATSASNLFLCGYFAELIDLVTQPGEPFPEIYDLFSRATAHLSRSPASMRALEFFESEHKDNYLSLYDHQDKYNSEENLIEKTKPKSNKGRCFYCY